MATTNPAPGSLPLTANDSRSTVELLEGKNGYSFSIEAGEVSGFARESGNVSIANDSNFYSFGPIRLNSSFHRAELGVNIPTGQTLTGMQFQILGKDSPNAPWYVRYSWANIQTLSTGPAPSDAPLRVFSDQASIVFPSPSNVTFDVNVEGWYAVDLQAGTNTGGAAVNAALYAGIKRKA